MTLFGYVFAGFKRFLVELLEYAHSFGIVQGDPNVLKLMLHANDDILCNMALIVYWSGGWTC